MFEYSGTMIVAAAIVILAVMLIQMGVKAIPQGLEYTVERFGRYRQTLSPGLHLIVPVIDRIGAKMNMMERFLEVTQQEVITKDNAMVIQLARMEYAVMRFESATMIALTIISTPAAYLLARVLLLPEEAWIWTLLFGLVAEAALITSGMFDTEASARHVGTMLAAHFGLMGIGNDDIREQVTRAVEHRVRMEDVLGGKGRATRGAMSETVAGVDSWLTGISRLANRLDRLRDDAAFQFAGKFRLRERIDDLEQRAREASDKKVQRQLRETIAGLRHQLRTIEELESLMERGELRLEHAVGALGTIHTQVTIFAARGMDAGDAARLADEISDEIGQVDAVLAAMDRIYEPGKSTIGVEPGGTSHERDA